MSQAWIETLKWAEDGLLPVIAQEATSGKVVMFAWMNREALALTAARHEAIYWSRSRQRLWHKGEESGHIQRVLEIRCDCDRDVILLQIEQVGGIACHTGRHSCFYHTLHEGEWQVSAPVIRDPAEIYR
jgi:phosphoribosyl-AMP cyclohydrolase